MQSGSDRSVHVLFIHGQFRRIVIGLDIWFFLGYCFKCSQQYLSGVQVCCDQRYPICPFIALLRKRAVKKSSLFTAVREPAMRVDTAVGRSLNRIGARFHVANGGIRTALRYDTGIAR